MTWYTWYIYFLRRALTAIIDQNIADSEVTVKWMITSRPKPKQCIFQSRTENKNLRKFFLNVWIKWVRIDRRKYIRRLPRVRVRPIDSMKTNQVSPTFTVDIWMCWNWNRSASPCPFQGRTRIFVRFMLKVNFLHSLVVVGVEGQKYISHRSFICVTCHT